MADLELILERWQPGLCLNFPGWGSGIGKIMYRNFQNPPPFPKNVKIGAPPKLKNLNTTEKIDTLMFFEHFQLCLKSAWQNFYKKSNLNTTFLCLNCRCLIFKHNFWYLNTTFFSNLTSPREKFKHNFLGQGNARLVEEDRSWRCELRRWGGSRCSSGQRMDAVCGPLVYARGPFAGPSG